jgi:hypothetical protein
MIPMSVEELTARADLVLHATVLSQSAQYDPAGRLHTRVEVTVLEVWKGQRANDRFTIVLAGGTLGEHRVAVPGQADYRVGEEVVAFLRLNQRGEGVTVGLAQGKFEVWQDKASKQKQARNLFLGRAPAAAGRSLLQDQEKSGEILLADLRRAVQGGRQ